MVVATDNVKLIGFAVVVFSDVFAFIVVAVVAAIVVVVAVVAVVVVVVVVVVVAVDDGGASVTDDKTAAGDKFVNEDDAPVVVVAVVVAFCVAVGIEPLEVVVEGIPTGFSVELETEVGPGVVDAVLCFLSII